MEIEKKYLIKQLPDNYQAFPVRDIEQAYLCISPTIRVRKDNDQFYLTYKSSGLITREEYNLPLTEASYGHLLKKADGHILTKKRYLIPLTGTGFTIELDIFEGVFIGLILAEVEFETEQQAHLFLPPPWFGEEVTFTPKYHNSTLSRLPLPIDKSYFIND